MVEDMTHFAIQKENRNVFYIAPTQIQARDIIWNTMRNRLGNIGKFNEQRLEIVVPSLDGGKSLIKLAGFENKENFRGKTSHKLVFDEVDTMRDFFTAWQEIFRPTLLDTGGDATFIGTPKKENPNLRRLEKLAETDGNYACFHFTSEDNPYLSQLELKFIKKEYEGNQEAYRQEILAEHIDDAGSLFGYLNLIDVFTNSVDKGEKYLTIDIADDGSDKTIFSFWEGLEEYKREEYERLNTEGIVNRIREVAHEDQIPYSHIAVDAIGVGAGVASHSLLNGIIGFKGSYVPFKTDDDIVKLPNVGHLSTIRKVSDYRNLRSQCVFILADLVNSHKIASRVTGRLREKIIEELSVYQDVSKGDGKRMATQSEDIKTIIGRSPDHASTWIIRMYWQLLTNVLPEQDEMSSQVIMRQKLQFQTNQANFIKQSNK